MKLEQKFEAVEPYHVNYLEGLVEVAEDFAIGFAEWLRDDRLNTEFWYEEMTIKELLEIYKKEKGL